MSDYLDEEAQESDDEEELNENERRRLKRIRAESDEDEDDDEEQLKEELKDFIADNVVESEESGDEQTRKRKRSDDEREELDDQLEDDDYDLLEENLGIKVQRQKKFRRVRVIDDESEEEEEPVDDSAVPEPLEGSDEEGPRQEESEPTAAEPGEAEEGEDSEQDELDDFIVDEEGNPLTGKGKKKRKNQFPDSALQDAQDIFGVDFDFEDVEQMEAEGSGEEGEEEGEEGEEDDDEYDAEEEDEEDEDGERRPRRRKGKIRKQRAKKVPKQSIFEIYEPAELDRGHFTDEANVIRTTDIPERFQTRSIPVLPYKDGAEDKELIEEAEWIFRSIFCASIVSKQNTEKMTEKPEVYVDRIRHALDFIRNQSLEVPFIASYRKEYIEPELNINLLWRIYNLDEKFCQLKVRKDSLCRLMTSMMSYQQDLVLEKPDDPLPDDMRVLTDADLERVRMAGTVEEFQDCYRHFELYFNHHLQPMIDYRRMKKRQEVEAKRKEREERILERQRRRRTKTITVTKTVTDEETGEEKEVEVEEEVDATDEEPEPEPEEEPEIPDEEEIENCKYPVRRDAYHVCRKAGLMPFANLYGLEPDKVAVNIYEQHQKHNVESFPVDPHEAAKDYCTAQFPEPADVIDATNYMVAKQIAFEPKVRKAVRERIFEKAAIDIRPTTKGFKEIDENHALYAYKYVSGKPVCLFDGDQFLTIAVGEDDKLIKIEFDCDIAGNEGRYVDEVTQLYLRDEFKKEVAEWNECRTNVIRIAFEKFLWPDMKKELRRKLLQEAKECVIQQCAEKLREAIKIAPYALTNESAYDDDDEWDSSAGLRIMGVAFANDLSLAAFACMIDVDGEVIDVIRLPALLKRKTSYKPEERIAKEKDLRTLKDFILRRKPHAVAIGAESREALNIKQDIEIIVKELSEEESFPEIPIEFINNDLAKIYANSIKGQADFREYPDLLRQAISIARRLQDPLLEFAQLCTPDDELQCVRFHPMQDQVTKDELIKDEFMEALYHEMINKVNEVGVDLNRCLAHPYTCSILQFVAGLGPRKAANLLKMLRQKSLRLENRGQLVTVFHMGPKVFINCAGFIKIDTNSLGDSADSYVEVLDSTRVHPETYEWARKMAIDALEYDDVGYEDANPAAALEEVLECPDRLKELDLDAFAAELDRQGYGNKRITLPDIRNELSKRYADPRVPFQGPSDDDKFAWFTKETPETLYIGKLVLATVIGIAHRKPQQKAGEDEENRPAELQPIKDDLTGLWQCQVCLRGGFGDLSDVWAHYDDKDNPCRGRPIGVRLRLDNGISGFIPIESLCDNPVTDPEKRVKPGMVIQCRIEKLVPERFSAICNSQGSVIRDEEDHWRKQRDGYYDKALEKAEVDKYTAHKKAVHKKKNAYMSRVIVHPNFLNIDYAGAEARMATMQQGDVIIRPSSQGVDHLTVTWKVTDGVHQHIDVKEKQKENAFSLGKSLWINGEEYEDLDEIVARHVNPMAAHAREIFSYKYYRDTQGGNRDIAEEILREEKRKAPSKIPYIISVVAKDMPGKFMLSYQPRLKARHEYITVIPEGFRYRRQVFETMNGLLKWFKEHHRDPIPSTPGAQSVANTARTPGGFSLASAATRDVIRQTAQTIPRHMYDTLSQVVAGGQTPHTPHYTPHTPFTHYTQTPYTPSGQTPYMTPYHGQTPRNPNQAHGTHGQQQHQHQNHHGQHVGGSSSASAQRQSQNHAPNYPPRNWHQQQPQHAQQNHHQAIRPPPAPAPPPVPAQSRSYGSSARTPSQDLNQWHKAAEAWANRTNRPLGARTPRTPGMTPRYDDPRRTPGTPLDRRTPRPAYPAPGDGTPLYDE